MAIDNGHVPHSTTVLHVMKQFITAMRSDAEIPDDTVSRLKELLFKGDVPKPDEINAAMFELLETKA